MSEKPLKDVCGSDRIPKLEMRGIVKQFPGVRALDQVNLQAFPGEILALVGENGAGKSTLMKVLSGVHPHGSYEGEILIDGKTVHFTNPRQAQAAGVAIIHQELNLIPHMTVAENIFLCREPKKKLGILDASRMVREAKNILDRLGVSFSAQALISSLPVGRQQLVEIAKALAVDAEILVLDEPTSALADQEIDVLFNILRTLSAEGRTLIYISHKLDEIYDLTDRITVLRDGADVGVWSTDAIDKNSLVAGMVGREVSDLFPPRTNKPGEITLKAKGLTVPDKIRPRGHQIKDIDLHVRAGEALGVAGLMGSGRTELLNALFGVYGKRCLGELELNGQAVKLSGPHQAIAHGLALVPEDRKLHGLALDMNVRENLTLVALRTICGACVSHRKERLAAKRLIEELDIKTVSSEVKINTLSGGNQQKVVMGKWLATSPRTLLLDEPTRGIDVGAKAEIYQLIGQLTARGVAVIIASSELLELIGLCDRIMVMRDGYKAGELDGNAIDEQSIMHLAMGTALAS